MLEERNNLTKVDTLPSFEEFKKIKDTCQSTSEWLDKIYEIIEKANLNGKFEQLNQYLKFVTKIPSLYQKYGNEKKYIKILVIYADLCRDKEKIFNFALKQKIGDKNAQFYIALGRVYEGLYQFTNCLNTYKRAFEMKAQPDYLLKNFLLAFQCRMDERNHKTENNFQQRLNKNNYYSFQKSVKFDINNQKSTVSDFQIKESLRNIENLIKEYNLKEDHKEPLKLNDGKFVSWLSEKSEIPLNDTPFKIKSQSEKNNPLKGILKNKDNIAFNSTSSQGSFNPKIIYSPVEDELNNEGNLSSNKNEQAQKVHYGYNSNRNKAEIEEGGKFKNHRGTDEIYVQKIRNNSNSSSRNQNCFKSISDHASGIVKRNTPDFAKKINSPKQTSGCYNNENDNRDLSKNKACIELKEYASLQNKNPTKQNLNPNELLSYFEGISIEEKLAQGVYIKFLEKKRVQVQQVLDMEIESISGNNKCILSEISNMENNTAIHRQEDFSLKNEDMKVSKIDNYTNENIEISQNHQNHNNLNSKRMIRNSNNSQDKLFPQIVSKKTQNMAKQLICETNLGMEINIKNVSNNCSQNLTVEKEQRIKLINHSLNSESKDKKVNEMKEINNTDSQNKIICKTNSIRKSKDSIIIPYLEVNIAQDSNKETHK